MGEGDGNSLENTVCAWAERICRLITEATPGVVSPRPGTPSALVNGLLSARHRGPDTSRDPPMHKGQGTEALCASLQAFLPSGKVGKNRRRRPRPPGRNRQAWDVSYRTRASSNGGSEQLGSTPPAVVKAALDRVERALQPLLNRRNSMPHSARQPTASFSTPGTTPCATPRAGLSTGLGSFGSLRNERTPQTRISPTNVELMSEERISSASPELRIQDVEAPASASTAAPSTGQQRPCLVPSLNLGSLGSVRKLNGGLSVTLGSLPNPGSSPSPGFGDDDLSTSDRSDPCKTSHSEMPLKEQASLLTDCTDHATVNGGAGPCIWGPSGPPPSQKLALNSQPRPPAIGFVKPLQLPTREEADSGMNLAETSGRDSVSSSCEASLIAGKSGRSSASSGRGHGQRLPGVECPRIQISLVSPEGAADSNRRSEGPETESQECDEPPQRRREEDHDMEVIQRRRENEVPQLALGSIEPLHKRAPQSDSCPGSAETAQDESDHASAVQLRITRMLGLLDKVDTCIVQQRVVSQAKLQDIENLMQEADTEPELEAGGDLARARLEEDSSDASSSADLDKESTVDGGNYL